MLALDIATKTGYTYDLGRRLYIGTVEGTPVYQYNFLSSIAHGDEVVVEELVAYNSRNPRTLVLLSQRVGYLINRFLEEIETVKLIHPGTWRKHLQLKQSKIGTRELNSAINTLLNVKLNLDECDSLGVWLCANDMQVTDLVSFDIYKLGHNAVNQKT